MVDSERGIRRQKVEERAVATEVWSVVGGEMGSSNESEEGEEMRREVGREQSGDTSLKRRREEEAETSGGNRAQSSGRMTARARVGGGKRGKQAPRVVRLAEATTAMQGVPGRAHDKDDRGKRVQWVGGRWRIEEIRSERREGGHGSADSGEERGSEVGRSNTDEAGIDSAEESERMRGVWELEAAAVESTAARRGYTIPAAWDEGTLIQAMARLDDPTLRWRYGDVAAEAQDEAEVSVEREDE